MALTVTKTDLASFVPEFKIFRCSCTFDSSYPTGGETLTVTDKCEKVLFAFVESPGGSGYVIDIDRTNFASGSMLLEAYYGDYSSASDGALVEVPNATDLSGLAAVDIIVFGTNL